MANIGKLNVSFHRPGWAKDRFPGDKETQAQGQQPNDLPERKNKPLVQFSRVNKYTRLPGVNAVNDALVRTVPVIGTQQELLRQIRAHVSSTRVPDLVIVGENHDHGVTLPTSYLLSTPGILKLRFTDALAAAEVDPTKFLREMQGAS